MLLVYIVHSLVWPCYIDVLQNWKGGRQFKRDLIQKPYLWVSFFMFSTLQA